MEKINCATSNCEHNIKGVCLAGVISIGENAKCLSRIKREGGPLAQNFADVEAGEDVFDKDLESLVQCAAGRVCVQQQRSLRKRSNRREGHCVCNQVQNLS